MAFRLPDEARARGWRDVEHEERCLLDDALHAQMPPGHRLKGSVAMALARRDDAVLFGVGLGTGWLARVALGPTGEFDTRGPACALYDSVEEWLDDDEGPPVLAGARPPAR